MSKFNGYLNLFFNLAAVVAYSISYSEEYSPITEANCERIGHLSHKTYGGRLKFLTILDLLGQLFYFSLCLLNAIIELFLYTNRNESNARKNNILRKFCNFMYTSFTYPFGLLVTLTFWTLYSIDRNLIFPMNYDSIIPRWQNHLLHTAPLITAILDSFITKHDYSRSFIKGILPTLLLSTGYLIWIFIVAYYGNIWIYPIMKILSPTYRALFFAILFVFVTFLYQSGKHLNQFIWRDNKNSTNHSQIIDPNANKLKVKVDKKFSFKPKKEY